MQRRLWEWEGWWGFLHVYRNDYLMQPPCFDLSVVITDGVS